MDKKGFTLVELLAVIVILSLLALLTVTSMTKSVNDSKEELSSTQINLIKSAAEIWGSENLMKLPSSGECAYITLGDLKKYGLMENSVIDAKTNQQISNDLKIKISTTRSSNNELVRSYEVNPESISGCIDISKICVAVTNSNKTTGNVPQGKYISGDEYICEVGTGKKYTFFVLSSDENNVNLIMDSNITKDGFAIKNNEYADVNNPSNWNTAWINESDYKKAGGQTVITGDEGLVIQAASDKGSITATNFLQQATENWEYIDTSNIRLPQKDEINDIFTDKTYSMDNFRLEYLPLWATNYLFNDKDGITSFAQMEVTYASKSTAYVDGKTHISRVGVYWLADKSSDSSAYEVGIDAGYYGSSYVFADYSIYPNGVLAGIRPVISLKKSQMPK